MATRFWVGGGSSANWNATGNTNWAATSGGAGNQTVPGAGDDVTFDGAGATGNSVSTVSATITVLSLTYTSGYTVTGTINALLTVTNALTISGGSRTFAGTTGFTCASFVCSHTAAATITLVTGVTYTVTTALTGNLSRTGALLVITSDNAVTKTILTLQNGATCNLQATMTRIDASNGRPIYTFVGTVTTCFNVFSFTDALTPAVCRIIDAGRHY